MSKVTKTKISIDESASAGTFEYEEGYHIVTKSPKSRWRLQHLSAISSQPPAMVKML